MTDATEKMTLAKAIFILTKVHTSETGDVRMAAIPEWHHGVSQAEYVTAWHTLRSAVPGPVLSEDERRVIDKATVAPWSITNGDVDALLAIIDRLTEQSEGR